MQGLGLKVLAEKSAQAAGEIQGEGESTPRKALGTPGQVKNMFQKGRQNTPQAPKPDQVQIG